MSVSELVSGIKPSVTGGYSSVVKKLKALHLANFTNYPINSFLNNKDSIASNFDNSEDVFENYITTTIIDTVSKTNRARGRRGEA